MTRPIIPEKNLLLQKKIKLPPVPQIPFWTKKTIGGIVVIVLMMFSALSLIFISYAIENYEKSVVEKTQSIMFDYVKRNGYKSTYRSKLRRDYKTFLPFIECVFNFNEYFYNDYVEINFITNNFSEQTKTEIYNKLRPMWKSVRVETSESDYAPDARKVNIYMERIRF